MEARDGTTNYASCMHLASLRRLALALVLSACGGKTSEGADASVESGAPVDIFACTGPGTCGVRPKACCTRCNPTIDDAEAIAIGYAEARRTELCGGDARPVCAKCQWFPPPQDVAAVCESGRCALLDLHASELSSCASDADCVVRDSPCCESCAPSFGSDLLALRRDRVPAYQALVCVPGTTCPDCVPRYPKGATAVCDATKHCAVKGFP